MEDKEKEIEELCREAYLKIRNYKRGDIPKKVYRSPWDIPKPTYGLVYDPEKVKRESVDKAEELIKKALILGESKSAEALRLSGFVDYIQMNDRYVLANYEKAFEIDPENWKLLYNIALYYQNCFLRDEDDNLYNDYNKASEFIIKAVEKNSKDLKLWTTLSEILMTNTENVPEFLPTALKYHLKFLESFPKNKLAIKITGEIYYTQKNYLEATKYFKRITGTNYTIWEKLAIAYKEIGDLDNAIKTYEKYIKGFKTKKEPRKFLFDLYISQGYKIASEDDIFDFMKNKEVREAKSRKLCSKALNLIQKGNAEESIKVLNEALELDHRSINAKLYLGFSNVVQGDVEKGFKMINEIIEQNPNRINAFFTLGNAFKFIGDFKKGIEAYEKGIALISDKDSNYFYHEQVKLAFLYNESNPQKALELFDDIIKNRSHNPVFLNLYGKLHILQKNPQKALELFIKALKLDHNRPELYVNIALIHAESGNFDASLAYLNAGQTVLSDRTPIKETLIKVMKMKNG